MKIEKVREKENKVELDTIIESIRNGTACNRLGGVLKHKQSIGRFLGIEPQPQLLSRCVADHIYMEYRVDDAHYDMIVDNLNIVMPQAYESFMNDDFFRLPCQCKENVDWKRVKRILPKTIDGSFSIQRMIDNDTSHDMRDTLSVIELYIRSGLQMIKIANRINKKKTDVCLDMTLFKKILMRNLVLDRPSMIGNMCDKLDGTDDLLMKCLELLENCYGDYRIDPIIASISSNHVQKPN